MTARPTAALFRSSMAGHGSTEFFGGVPLHLRPFVRIGAVLLIALTATFCMAAPAHAQGGNAAHIRGALLVENGKVAPGGGDTLALSFEPDAGWHGYWSNPGDAGFGIDLKWTLPKGVTLDEAQFPVPQTLTIAGLMNHVYEGPHALLFDLNLDKSVAPGTRLPIALDAQWLACTDEICVPETGHFETTLVAGPGGQAATARFDRFRSALPTPLDRPATFEVANGLLRLAIPFPAAAAAPAPHFFASADGMVDYAAPQRFSRVGDRLVMETRAAGASPKDVSGLLALGDGTGLSISAARGAVPTGGVPLAGSADPADADAPTLLLSFGAALLGGLLLNILPCVFPILGLKAISLSRAAIGEAEARRDALAYGAGAILACLALGGLLLALRARGEAVGWAFQLQEPAVVVALFLLTVGIVANLLGMFTVPGLAVGDRFTRSGGASGSFWTGALAAFVATPCTGPFMAAALGAALLLPVPAALLLFAGLGIGLALPFLAIGFIPTLRRWLPKPGAWMETFRKWMALPMALTALALGWLLWRLGGPNLIIAGVVAAVAMLAILLLLGRGQRGGAGAVPLLAAGALAVLLLPPALVAAAPESSFAAHNGRSNSLPFDEARLAQLQAEGRPIFLYFTADWCVTCKANEAAAIEREGVARAFERGNVAVMSGDFTRRDPAIARFLAAHGRAGVPFYLFYPKDGGEPKELPQLLSQDMLIDLAAR